jgi:lycopene cyclase domain-containing protein
MGSCKILFTGKELKEYTILSVISVFVVFVLDQILKTKLFSARKFWIFWGIMFVIISIINGYLTWRPIVTYGSGFYLGIRLFTIPIEDFLYGFSLLTGNIIIWEYYTLKKESRKSE